MSRLLKIMALVSLILGIYLSNFSGYVYAEGNSSKDSSEVTVFASGDPTDIGKEYGKQAKNEIIHNVELFKKSAGDVSLTQSDLQKAADNYEQFLIEKDTHLLDQYKAIAENSSVSLDDLLAFNALEEKVIGDGCMTVIATGTATQGHKTYYHKNRDATRGYKQIVLQIQPSEGYKFIGITSAGSTGIAMGINEKGVSIGNNVLDTWDNGPGYGNLTVIRKTLENAESAREAVSYIKSLPRAMGSAYGIADANEGAFTEVTHSAFAVKWVINDAIAHTNHYILPEMQKYDALPTDLNERNRWSWYLSTNERLQRATYLLSKQIGKINPQRLIQVSEDENGNDPLYWIDAQSTINDVQMGSVSAATFDGSKLRMWSQLGQPSVAPAVPLEVDRPIIPKPFNSGDQSDRIDNTSNNR